MRRFGKLLGCALAGMAILVATLWVLGPYDKADLGTQFDPVHFNNDLDRYFAQQEARFDDITPGVEKRVVWAGEPGAQTLYSVLYIQGLSATSEEIRPVPDKIAAALDANLVYTRLQGHGRSGHAMGEAAVSGWMSDVAEGLAAARLVGEKVVVLSTSTGGTLVAATAQDPDLMANVVGAVFVSPNFGINNSVARILTLPAARYWLPLLGGKPPSFPPLNDAQRLYWTTEYSSTAVFPMAALVKTVVNLDHRVVDVPALF